MAKQGTYEERVRREGGSRGSRRGRAGRKNQRARVRAREYMYVHARVNRRKRVRRNGIV